MALDSNLDSSPESTENVTQLEHAPSDAVPELVEDYGYETGGMTDEYYVPELPAQYTLEDSVIEDNRIGQLLLRHRLLSLDTLEECLDYQLANPGSLLGEVVIERGIATVEDIQGILKLQLSELRLGQILMRTKCISQEQLDIALVDQENTGELLGSILIGFGFCTPEQINWAIDQQNKD